MVLDDLRLIILNERESGKLSEIRGKTFDKAHEYILALYREAYGEAQSLDRYLTEKTHDVLEEINSVKETIREIVRLRTRKIIMLAMLQMESGFTDRDEIKKMLPAEKEMFEEISRAIERSRQTFLTDLSGMDPAQIVPETPRTPDESEPSPSEKKTGQELAVIRMLHDTEPFLGVDGKVYTLDRGDIVALPEQNAAVLCKRNIALNIRLGK